MATDPADLDQQVSETRERLRDLRRVVAELDREYARLNPDRVVADTFGDPTTGPDALADARAALSDLSRALGFADDAADVVQRHTSRLRER